MHRTRTTRTRRSDLGRPASGRARGGFTLIEVLIVIAIVVALGGLVGAALFARQDEAKVGLNNTDMNSIENSIQFFYNNFNRVPTEEEGVTVLWDRGALEDPEEEDKWTGYLQEPLDKDQWGTEWTYESTSAVSYRLVSAGPDKELDTDDDIERKVNMRPTGDDEEGEFDFGGSGSEGLLGGG